MKRTELIELIGKVLDDAQDNTFRRMPGQVLARIALKVAEEAGMVPPETTDADENGCAIHKWENET